MLNWVPDRNGFSGLEQDIIISVEPYSILTCNKPHNRICMPYLTRLAMAYKAHSAVCCSGMREPDYFVREKWRADDYKKKEEEFCFANEHDTNYNN